MDDSDFFSCVDPDLSRTNVTEEAWSLGNNGSNEVAVLAEAILQTMFVIVGVPWNSIVLITIIMEKLYRECTYILLLNLVVADILVCICVLPFNVYSAFAREFAIGNSDFVRCGICHTIVVIILSLVYISLFTLALMSVDRFIYIKWPLHYTKYVTIPRVMTFLLLVYVLCIGTAILPVVGVGEIKFSKIVSSCSLITRGQGKLIENNQFVIILVILGLFPFATTLVCNVLIMVIIYRTSHGKFNKKVEHNKVCAKDSTAKRKTERKLREEFQRQQLNLVKLFGALFAVNFITWVPTILIAVVSAIIGHQSIPNSLSIVQYLAYVSQPVLHPMLETCFFTRARSEVCKCLCCFCARHGQSRKATFAATAINYFSVAGDKRGSDFSTTSNISEQSQKTQEQDMSHLSSLSMASAIFTIGENCTV